MDAQEKKILNLITHAVFVIEADSEGVPRYSACNAHALKSMGKTEEDVVGLTARELFPGRLGELAFGHQVEGLKSGKERSYEHVLPLSEGHRLVFTRLTPDKDGYGNFTRLIGESTYVSSRQIVEKLRAKTQAVNTEMEDFVYLAAHDLRVPMRHVITIAGMLREDFQGIGDEKLDLIDMLENIGKKSMSLIGDVLTHAQSTTLIAECVEFDLRELLQEIMVVLDPMNHCTVSAPKVHIKGDRTATQIILRNLIDNAIKSPKARALSDGKAATLHLVLSATAADGFFEIGVQDNGCGFEDTAVVFLNGGKLKIESGFGMLGVRRLIHSRGGTLMAANSHESSGAVVSFSLPGTLRSDVAGGSEGKRLAG